MKALVQLIVVLALTGCNAHADFDQHPTSFRVAKTLAMEVYKDNRTTFYCECTFDTNKVIDHQSCNYQTRKQATRALRMEWEHIVPASRLGANLACWKRGGRKDCTANDVSFQRMASDLHNLVPSVGELNADRSNRIFGEVRGEPRKYGKCDFEVDFDTDTVEPKYSLRGDIARTYLYMNDRYNLGLPESEVQMYAFWNLFDPVSQWEIERNRRIKKLQGNYNCFVAGC